jgi:hypothetical protein
MVAWEWVVLALGVVAGLQLLALRYALRARSADGDGHRTVRQAVEHDRVDRPDPVERPVTGAHADDDSYRCPHCGARNDPQFTYCQRCVSFLGR